MTSHARTVNDSHSLSPPFLSISEIEFTLLQERLCPTVKYWSTGTNNYLLPSDDECIAAELLKCNGVSLWTPPLCKYLGWQSISFSVYKLTELRFARRVIFCSVLTACTAAMEMSWGQRQTTGRAKLVLCSPVLLMKLDKCWFMLSWEFIVSTCAWST